MANTKTTQNAAEQQPVFNQKEAFVLKYKNALIACVAVIIIAVLAIVFFKNNAAKKQAAASAEMSVAESLFAMAVQTNDSVSFARCLGDSLGNGGFLEVVDKYGSTDAGKTAKLYAGLCYAHMGQWQEAVNYLEKYSDAGDQMISKAAMGALGNAYAHLEQFDKAVETLKKAAEKADNNSLSPLFLVQAGEILENQGKKAEALKLYQQVKEKYVGWAQYQLIDQYIQRATE